MSYRRSRFANAQGGDAGQDILIVIAILWVASMVFAALGTGGSSECFLEG